MKFRKIPSFLVVWLLINHQGSINDIVMAMKQNNWTQRMHARKQGRAELDE